MCLGVAPGLAPQGTRAAPPRKIVIVTLATLRKRGGRHHQGNASIERHEFGHPSGQQPLDESMDDLTIAPR